jgi:hypothetical protein
MIGQMLEMKITHSEAGSVSLNTYRPIGSQASGDTGRSRLMIGAGHAGQELEAADHETERNADQRSQAEAGADAVQRMQDVPADALVVGAVVVERVGEQFLRRGPGLGRAGQAFRRRCWRRSARAGRTGRCRGPAASRCGRICPSPVSEKALPRSVSKKGVGRGLARRRAGRRSWWCRVNS